MCLVAAHLPFNKALMNSPIRLALLAFPLALACAADTQANLLEHEVAQTADASEGYGGIAIPEEVLALVSRGHPVYRVTTTGEKTPIGGSEPRSVSVDPVGNVLITEHDGGFIRRVTYSAP